MGRNGGDGRDPTPTRSPWLEVGGAGAEDSLVPVRSRRRPWWALASIALGVLWMLFFACMYLTGYSATVTVTGGQDDGLCDVMWHDPSGATLHGESDCNDEPVGSRFPVRVSGWPHAGEPTPTEAYVGMSLVVGLPLAGVGGIGLLRRRPRQDAGPEPARRTRPELATRTTTEGAPDAAVSDRRTAAGLVRAARRAWAAVAAAVVAGAALLGLFGMSVAGDTDLRNTGVTTVGTIVHVDPGGKWDPGGAAVRFTAGGETAARYVSLGSYADEYEEGQTVDVVYDLSDPERFSIDDVGYEPRWMTWATGGALTVTAAAGIIGLRWVSAHRRARRLLRTHPWTPVRVQVRPDDSGLCFTTADGVNWTSSRNSEWPQLNRQPRQLSGWGLPDEDPADVPVDQAAWWVCDGTTAVFSPDQGGPLVLARLC